MHQKQVQELRRFGNECFKKKDYLQAIEKYSEAIALAPTVSLLYSNRARCLKQLGELEKSHDDAEKAVQLDDKNIKAYFLKGETLVELAMHTKDTANMENGIEQLKKCLRLCPRNDEGEFKDRFVSQLYRAKKKLWELNETINQQRRRTLRKYLIHQVESEENLKEEEKDRLNDTIDKLLADGNSIHEDVPRSLLCPITHKLMLNPVCNEFGNSFEKKAYLKSLHQNGRYDPLTKKEIKTTILYPNLNLRKATESFLEEHPWAFDEVF